MFTPKRIVAGGLALALSPVLALAAPAASEPGAVRVRENVRLGIDRRPARGRDLPALLADPADPRHVVEVDFDYVHEACEYNVSFDAGATWTGGTLSGPAGFPTPSCHLNNNHQGGRPAHTSIGFGSAGNVYTTFMSEQADESDSMGVLKSTDGGRTFAPSVIAIAAVPTRTTPPDLSDPDVPIPGTTKPGIDYRRPQLAVTPDPAGDRVYVSGWSCTLGLATPPPANHRPGRCDGVAFTSSKDGGKTFSPSVLVNTPALPDTDFDGSQPVVHGNTITIVYRRNHRLNPEAPPAQAKFAASLLAGTSTDGGVTWTTSTVRPEFTPARGFIDPVLAADHDGVLTLAYEEKVGQSGTPPQTRPIADIFVQHSSDGGKTWTAPVRVNDDPDVKQIDHFEPWVSVAADGRIDLTWYDTRNGYPNVAQQDVYYASSPGKNAPFSANHRVTTRTNSRALGYSAQLGTFPPVSTPVDGGVLVAWADTRNANFTSNNQDIYQARLNLSGAGAPPTNVVASSGLPIVLSQMAYPGGADYVGGKTVTKVVVVNEHDAAGALAGAVLARASFGPLLTSPPAALPKVVKDEIARIQPVGAIIIGGEPALSAGVVDAIKGVVNGKPVDRVAGRDAAETAALVAGMIDSRTDADKADNKPRFLGAVLVNPTAHDASVGVEVAASMAMPLLFVDRDAVPAATTAALMSLGITKTIVIGGIDVVSDAVVAKLPGAVRATAPDAVAKAQGLIGLPPVPSPTNVVFAADSARPVSAAVIAAAVARVNGTLLLVPGGSAKQALAATAGLQGVDGVTAASYPSTGVVSPWIIVLMAFFALLGVVGIVLLAVARSRAVRSRPEAATA